MFIPKGNKLFRIISIKNNVLESIKYSSKCYYITWFSNAYYANNFITFETITNYSK